MSYNAGIPNPQDKISQSQPLIRTNFNQLNSIFSHDHVEYTDATVNKRGMHRKVTYQAPLGVDPNVTITDVASLYTKKPSLVELFFQRGPLAADVVQMTGLNIIDSGTDGMGGGYQTVKSPFGLTFIFGFALSASGGRTLTLSGTTIFSPSLFVALASCFGGGAVQVSITPTVGTNQVNVNTGALAPLRWMVIQP